jgi:hypothetical protein
MLLQVSHVPIAYAYTIARTSLPLNASPNAPALSTFTPARPTSLSINLKSKIVFHMRIVASTFRIRSRTSNNNIHRTNMAFSFGFSGDDIEEDPNDVAEQNQQEQGQSSSMDVDVPPPIAARTHDLDEVVGMRLRILHQLCSVNFSSFLQPLISLFFLSQILPWSNSQAQ